MSVLITENGNVFLLDKIINKLTSPVSVGKFDISEEAKTYIFKNSLCSGSMMQLFEFIPKEMKTYCENQNLLSVSAATFDSSLSQEKIDKEIYSKYLIKILVMKSIFVLLAGGFFISILITYITQAGDWLFIPSEIEHWANCSADVFWTFASYCSMP